MRKHGSNLQRLLARPASVVGLLTLSAFVALSACSKPAPKAPEPPRDTEPPTVSLMEPADLAMVSGPLAIEISAKDNRALKSVQYQIENVDSDWKSLSLDGQSNSYKHIWDPAGVPDGSYRMALRVEDQAGNIATTFSTIMVDNAPGAPVKLVQQSPAVPDNGGYVELVWEANGEADVVEYNVYRSSSLEGPYALMSSTDKNYYKDDGLSNGAPYYYMVRAVDKAGHRSEASAAAMVIPMDTKAPAISSVALAKLGTRSVDILLNTDEAASAQIEYGASPELGKSTEMDSLLNTSKSITLLDISAGATYYYRVHVKDAAGNVSTSDILKLRTLADKAPAVSITSHADKALVGGVITLRASASDDWGLESVEYAVGGSEYKPMVRDGSGFVATVDTTTLSEESYTIVARANDDAGQMSTFPIDLRIDNKAPSLAGLALSGVDRSTAEVRWSTNEPALTRIEYGRTAALDKYAIASGSAATDHRSVMAGLEAGTKYFYRVRSADMAGNETLSDVLSFETAPDMAPSVKIVSPSDGQSLGRSALFQVEASDDWKLMLVDYALDNGSYKPLQKDGSANLYFADIRTTDASNGNHLIKVRAKDDAGNITERSLSLVFDNLAPTVSSIAAGGILRDRVEVSWSANEPSRGYIEYGASAASLGSVTPMSPNYLTSNRQSFSGLEPNTVYYYRVHAEDAIGNKTVSSVFSFKTGLDLAPTLSVGSPADNALLRDVVNMDIIARDDWALGSVMYSVDGGANIPLSVAADKAQLDTKTIPDGSHSLDIRAYDDRGQIAQSRINIWIDNTKPVVSGLQVVVFDASTADIVWSTSEPTVTRFEYGLSSALGGTKVEDSLNTVHRINLADLTSGATYHFKVGAMDLVGNLCDCETFNFAMPQDLAPVSTLVNPLDMSMIGGFITLQVNAQDDWDLRAVEYSLDSGDFVPLALNAANSLYEASVDTHSLTEGMHTLTIRAKDSRAQMSTRQISVSVDNLAPALNVGSPLNNAIWSGSVVIEADASDLSGAPIVSALLDGVDLPLAMSTTQGAFSATIDTLLLAGGRHNLKLSAASPTNRIASRFLTVFVDNAMPTAAIAGPLDGSKVSGATLMVVATDDWAIDAVEYSVDGGLFRSMSFNSVTGQYEANITKGSLSDGVHGIVVRSIDKASKISGLASMSLTTDATMPVSNLLSPTLAAPVLESGVDNLIQLSAADDTTGADLTAQYQLFFPPAGVIPSFTGLEILIQVPAVIPAPLAASPKDDLTEMPTGLPAGTYALMVIFGTVTAVSADGEWQIGSQPVFVYQSADTVVRDIPTVGDSVKIVATRTLQPGPIVAEVIRTLVPGPNPVDPATFENAFLFNGVVESTGDHLWKVGGIEFVVDEPGFAATIDDKADGTPLTVGDPVTMEFGVPLNAVAPAANPAAWLEMDLNVASGLWEATFSSTPVVLDTQGWLYVDVIDGAGNVNSTILKVTLVANGRAFALAGATTESVTGKVTIEPTGVTKPNHIGIEWHGTGLQPGETYTLEVADDLGNVVSVSFVAGSGGNGSVLFEADTDIADEFTATLQVTGAGF